MSSGFPPQPVYPVAIDTDRTLYLVYNTTETILSANNAAWSEEILIEPQPVGKPEIWADNGFATIEGELLYYDAVAKNSNGKVYKLRRCLRNLGGRHTQFNPCGTSIRGFVIAEHHIQIVDAILKIEDFVGENFSPLEETLDWRIRNLAEEPVIFDDFSCPDIEFDFNIISSDINTGTVAQFLVNVQGSTGSFELQFGDGTSTTLNSGTHTYAPNASIDPVVIVSNGNCQIVQTPMERESVEEPTVTPPVPPFSVPIPVPPPIPPFVFPSQQIPSVDINFPPIVFPTIDLSTTFNTPSVISFVPSNPLPSIISFSAVGNIPSVISVTPAVPSTISLVNTTFTLSVTASFEPVTYGTPPTFTPITYDIPPTFTPISWEAPPTIEPVSWTLPPCVSVCWGTPPLLSCQVIVQCPSCTSSTNPSPMMMQGFGMDGGGIEDSFDNIEVQYDMVGFPSEIIITPPEIPPITIQHNLPNNISLIVPEIKVVHDLPTEIRISSDVHVPSEIRIIPPSKEEMIHVISFEVPQVKFEFDVTNLPTSIPLEVPDRFPDIKVDASGIPESIRVDGIPEVIRIEHSLPSTIQFEVPSDIKVPLVFEGPPLTGELKVNWGFDKLTEEEKESLACFALVPCKR